jgi:hypothetical protein
MILLCDRLVEQVCTLLRQDKISEALYVKAIAAINYMYVDYIIY